MTHRIAVLAGDGVGPEVVHEARLCVDESSSRSSGATSTGGRTTGSARRDDAGGRGREPARLRLDPARRRGPSRHPRSRDAVGIAAADQPAARPLGQRRPVRLLEGVPCALAGRGPGDVDMVFVRENSEGEYSGVGGRAHQGHPGEVGIETAVFTRAGIERVVEHLKGKLGSGKISMVKTDNDFQRYDVNGSVETWTKTGAIILFIKKTFNAAYLNYNRQYKGFMFQAGVRFGEHRFRRPVRWIKILPAVYYTNSILHSKDHILICFQVQPSLSIKIR